MKSTRSKTGNPSTELGTNSSSGIRVAIGMSGGVDSSVAALLLKKQGFNVAGFFMKLWHDPCGTGENACCDERAQMDARAVAEKIGIPFYVVDARTVFKKEVTDYFIEEYKNARTPNPCLLCNKKIKFGWLLEMAKKSGCQYLATGHYARITREARSDGFVHHLLKAADESKDQSYFLSGLSQEQLSHVIFPLGGLTKDEVRKIAQENNLPVYSKKESQEVCFVEDDYRDFLKRNIPDELVPGEIVDAEGQVLGFHHGLANYTIGQRKGIDQSREAGFSADRLKGKSNKAPLYVIGLDQAKNRLIVGKEEELYISEMAINKLNYIDPDIDITKIRNLAVKIRYRAPEVKCEIGSKAPVRTTVKFKSPQRAITPGQFAVFYSGEEIIGNAEIA